MTYPPQQPGPYGPQPGPYGGQPGAGPPQVGNQPYGRPAPQDPYGRQNGYGFEGSQDATSQYNTGQDATSQYDTSQYSTGQYNTSQYSTQQFPQTGGYSPQDPYGQQQNEYPRQGQFAGGEPPRKKNQTGLIVAVVIAGVVVIGGVVALVVMNSGGKSEQAQAPAPTTAAPQAPGAPATTADKPKSSSSSSSKATTPSKSTPTGPASQSVSGAAPGGKANPQELADFVIGAYNSADGKGVTDTTCRSRKPNNDFTVPTGFQMESTGPIKVSGESATMPVKASYQGQTQAGVLSVKKESGLWCLSGLGSS
jgi:hypothetical protein